MMMKDNKGIRPTVEERPSTEQLSELYGKYGQPAVHHRTWNLSQLNEDFSPPACSGEVVMVIHDNRSMIAYVARCDHPTDWFFPMGRINIGESIDRAAIREAFEETGLMVEISSIPLLYVVKICFNDWDLIRWNFIVIGRMVGGDIRPVDIHEIENASFFNKIPGNSDPFLMEWAEDIMGRI